MYLLKIHPIKTEQIFQQKKKVKIGTRRNHVGLVRTGTRTEPNFLFPEKQEESFFMKVGIHFFLE